MINICDLLAGKSNFHHLTSGADLDKIREAEESLGVVFSQEYKEITSKYGAVSFGIHELTGVCDSKRLNVVETTERERSYNDTIPANMYLIEVTGMEDVTVWQAEDGKIYRISYHKDPVLIAESLYQYIELS
ncbi:MAG: SMI1/KNR4 family protein [Clostridiales bacterium]|nr:SMI1/KNR4 family protein [Clostridiales bacterium]